LVLSLWLSRIPCVLPLGVLVKYLPAFLWFYVITGQYQENTQGISQNQGSTCRYLTNTPSGNTQGIRDNHKDRTNGVFPPFNLPRKTQTITKRSRLSLNVIFWSKIQRRGSKRQSEYSWAKYLALPVVGEHHDRVGCTLRVKLHQRSASRLYISLKIARGMWPPWRAPRSRVTHSSIRNSAGEKTRGNCTPIITITALSVSW